MMHGTRLGPRTYRDSDNPRDYRRRPERYEEPALSDNAASVWRRIASAGPSGSGRVLAHPYRARPNFWNRYESHAPFARKKDEYRDERTAPDQSWRSNTNSETPQVRNLPQLPPFSIGNNRRSSSNHRSPIDLAGVSSDYSQCLGSSQRGRCSVSNRTTSDESLCVEEEPKSDGKRGKKHSVGLKIKKGLANSASVFIRILD